MIIKTAVSVARELFVYQNFRENVVCYDVDNDKWSKIPYKITKHFCNFSTVKVTLHYKKR